MAANFRNDTWKEDDLLRNEMKKYVTQGLQREEILDFLKRYFSQYAWSMRTLDRRLRYFEIYYHDKTVPVDEVRVAVQKEFDGPGKRLGYRTMYHKVRQEHELDVPHDLVHAMMYELDPDGLTARGLGEKKKVRAKGNFTSKGSNRVCTFYLYGV